MCDKTYNGWTGGYETWLVALWYGNDEGSQNYVEELARDAYKDAVADKYFTREQVATAQLADVLKNDIEENSPAGVTGMYADLMNAAISEIDFHEIAEHFIEDINKTAFEEEAETTE